MNLRKITIDNKLDLEFVEKLYIDSFPTNERRPVPDMHRLMEENDKFGVYLLINEEGIRVGFLTYWSFDQFVYLEHFAVNPEFRSGGYGRKSISALINNISKPLVGEIELPETSDFAARRLTFYEKQGFRIWNISYEQPPYIEGGEYIPMHLITYGNIDLSESFEMVRNKLYKEVYKIN